jgi:hypothetical protein
MTGFTLIAVGIFLATVIHQIVANPVVTTLPTAVPRSFKFG